MCFETQYGKAGHVQSGKIDIIFVLCELCVLCGYIKQLCGKG